MRPCAKVLLQKHAAAGRGDNGRETYWKVIGQHNQALIPSWGGPIRFVTLTIHMQPLPQIQGCNRVFLASYLLPAALRLFH